MSNKRNISNQETSFERQYLDKLLSEKKSQENLINASEDFGDDDPFMAEALEGFSMSSASDIKKAISDLDDNISTRTGYRIASRKGFAFNSPYFMVAASALLLAVAALFIFRPSLPDKTTLSELTQKEQQKIEIIAKDHKTDGVENLAEFKPEGLIVLPEKSVPAPPSLELLEGSGVELADEAVVEADASFDYSAETRTGNATAIDSEILNKKALEGDLARESTLNDLGESKEILSNESDGKDDGYIFAERGEIKNVQVEEIQKIPQRSVQSTSAVEIAASKSKGKFNAYGVQQAAATYPGGSSAMNAYLVKNASYPKKFNETLSGKVLVSFVVDDKGKVREVKILKSLHPVLDKEAIRVVKNMPKWSPALNQGKNISSSHNVLVTFQK